MQRFVLGLTALAGLAVVTSATANEPVFLATSGTTLYRTTPAGVIDSFNLGTPITSITRDRDGTLWATSPVVNQHGGRSLYVLEDAGTNQPWLREVSSNMERNYSAMTFMGPRLFAFDADSDAVIRINTTTFEQEIFGRTGSGNIAAGGAAYDRSTRTTYLGLNLDTFLHVDLRLPKGSTEMGQHMGDFGIDAALHGFELFQGVLYAAIQRGDNGALDIGTVDLETGAFSPIRTLDPSAGGIAVGLVVIPAPAGSLALLGAAGLLLTRRRR